MHYENKLERLNELVGCFLIMREPRDWYIDQDIMIGDGSGTGRSAVGNGSDPSMTVHDHWRQVTEGLDSREYIIARGKHWCWDGIMWREVK